MKPTTLSLALAFFGMTACATHAAREPINCALPHTDTRINQCTQVRQASEFAGCLRASDVTAHTCIVMDTDLSFCADQTSIPITAVFDQSNRTLDCAGGTIDHGWGRSSLPGGPATASNRLMPAVRLIDDRSLNDITIRRCTLRGTRHMGVEMKRFFGGQLGADGQLDPGEPLPVGHHDILLEDLKIIDVHTGVFLGNFSRNVTLQSLHIDNTERISIYSEAGSHRILITDSLISNNRTREAVAIDSTYDSEIRNTLFVNNREGAINMYQNCGELKGIVCPVIRPTTASNNRIIGNAFVNTGVTGVQLASRQGRNHTEGWCATLDGEAGQFTDTSENNLVADNVFVCREGTSLVVMDGPNTVRDNRVVARNHCIPYEVSTGGLGKEASTLLEGLRLEGNIIDSSRPPRLRNVGAGVVVVD